MWCENFAFHEITGSDPRANDGHIVLSSVSRTRWSKTLVWLSYPPCMLGPQQKIEHSENSVISKYLKNSNNKIHISNGLNSHHNDFHETHKKRWVRSSQLTVLHASESYVTDFFIFGNENIEMLNNLVL